MNLQALTLDLLIGSEPQQLQTLGGGIFRTLPACPLDNIAIVRDTYCSYDRQMGACDH
jgi:hypothetical protein